MTTTPNLPPLPDGVADEAYIFRANLLVMSVESAKAYALAAYQAGRDAGLVAAHAVLDDVGARLQQAHDDEDDSYWAGVGATVQAGEIAILSLKSDTKGGV